MVEKGKIFCIGLNKTGTTSLHQAFQILGLRSVHYTCEKGSIKEIIRNNYLNKENLLEGIENFDAYSDWNYQTTNHLFREFDKQYPGSRFILNTRDIEDWIKSREKHVNQIPHLRELQKKYPKNPWYNLDVQAWREDYHNHHQNVLDYFKYRQEDLLIFNIGEGDGWEKLCTFLNVPVPDEEFPYTNRSTEKSFLKRLKTLLKSLKGFK